ncbi:unnamed protein product, partial [Ascophyllum nodosum]
VNDFTTSFADGRALCLLVHYYHPWMLPLNVIRRTTAHLPKTGGEQSEMEDWSVYLDASKTVVTVLAHLWARLLESSAEIRSAILLQRSYRSYLRRTGRGDIAERTHGAKTERRERLAG